jgi:glycosyltransferase involved in cell wall biosynthesis
MCEYALRDQRITVIDFSRNRGVSAARNAAMAIAGGEYLGFVDSDDAVEPDFYEKLYAKAVETGALITKGVLLRIAEDGGTRWESINESVRENRLHFVYQWTTAIYQTEFIRKNGINCPLGITNNEDDAFLHKAVALAPGVATVDDACYCYYRRSGSAHSDKLVHERFLAVLKSYEDVIAFINTREVTPQDYGAILWYCLSCCNELLSSRAYPEDEKRASLACAETAIKLYRSRKYQEISDAMLAARFPDCGKYLLMGDVGGLADYLLRRLHETQAQRIAAELRARLAAAKEQ